MFKHGYSLFELIIVLGLITFLVSLSFYFMGMCESAQLRAELDRLYAVLIFMQRKALLENKIMTVTFDCKKNSYTADQQHILSKDVIFGIPADMFGPPANPTTNIKEPITWPGQRITFYLDETGTVSAGALYLTNKKKTMAYALTCDASCVPHMRRYRYDGRWVLIQD